MAVREPGRVVVDVEDVIVVGNLAVIQAEALTPAADQGRHEALRLLGPHQRDLAFGPDAAHARQGVALHLHTRELQPAIRRAHQTAAIAVRAALGARPSEIARQLMLEAETLVALGIAGGVLLALWLTPVVGRLALEPFGDVANLELAVSWRVIGVVAIVAAGCAGLCGLLPAFVGSRGDVVEVLSRGGTPAPREIGVRRMFVTAVVALACVLLVSLSVVGRSLRNVLNVDPGFDARGVLTLPLLIQGPDAERASFLSVLHGALEERLGPRTVSVINELPLTHDGGRRLMRIRPTEPTREVVLREAGTAYFDVMRIPVVAGHPLDARDDAHRSAGVPPIPRQQRPVLRQSIAGEEISTTRELAHQADTWERFYRDRISNCPRFGVKLRYLTHMQLSTWLGAADRVVAVIAASAKPVVSHDHDDAYEQIITECDRAIRMSECMLASKEADMEDMITPLIDLYTSPEAMQIKRKTMGISIVRELYEARMGRAVELKMHAEKCHG